MKRFALACGILFISGCTMVPNLGGGEMVTGTVNASGDVKVAVVRGTGADLTNADVVPVTNGRFSYMIPSDADVLTIVAFRDQDGNGKYTEGEPNSMSLSSGSTYLELTRINEKWEIKQHASGGTNTTENLASANLSLG